LQKNRKNMTLDRTVVKIDRKNGRLLLKSQVLAGLRNRRRIQQRNIMEKLKQRRSVPKLKPLDSYIETSYKKMCMWMGVS